MIVEINGAKLNVEVIGKDPSKPVLIAHHGGGGIGSLALLKIGRNSPVTKLWWILNTWTFT